MRHCAALLAVALFGACGANRPPIPGPTPTPAPPPWECKLDMPGCHEVGQTCSLPGKPCWHNPTDNPEHCEKAFDCPDPTPTPTPTPTPPPGDVCPSGFPQGVPPGDFTIGPVITNFAPTVNAAQRTFTGCDIGTDCPTGLSADDYMHAINNLIRVTGLCAGRHVDTTPGGTDEIAVTNDCTGWWEGYKIYNYGGGKVIWSPNANRPAWKIHPKHCASAPPPGVCTDPDPRGKPAEFNMKHHGQLWDSTYRIVNRQYCDQIPSFVGRQRCPVREEGDPERPPCEEVMIGEQQWWCDGQKIEAEANPAQARCHGHVRTCTEDGVTCAEAVW